MEPIYQTLLTLGCMVSTYYWGRYVGASTISDEIVSLLGCKAIEVTDEGEVFFVDRRGNMHKPKDAFK